MATTAFERAGQGRHPTLGWQRARPVWGPAQRNPGRWEPSDRAWAVERSGPVIVAPSKVGELISEAVLAVETAAVARDLADSIHPHPTLSETLREAAKSMLGQATHRDRPRKLAGGGSGIWWTGKERTGPGAVTARRRLFLRGANRRNPRDLFYSDSPENWSVGGGSN
ncbi:MAG: hypothetical protein ACKOJF_09570 [Planctomycetaceae bacterium]